MNIARVFICENPALLLFCWICFAVVRYFRASEISSCRIDGLRWRWHSMAQSSGVPCLSSLSLISGKGVGVLPESISLCRHKDSFTSSSLWCCSIMPVCGHLFLKVAVTNSHFLLVFSYIVWCDTVSVTWNYTETSGVSVEPGVDIANKLP